MKPQLRTIDGGRRVRSIDWRRRPNTFTSQEQVIERLSQLIMTCGKTYAQIAVGCDVSDTTIRKLAARETLWPRPKTFFGVLNFFDATLSINMPAQAKARA